MDEVRAEETGRWTRPGRRRRADGRGRGERRWTRPGPMRRGAGQGRGDGPMDGAPGRGDRLGRWPGEPLARRRTYRRHRAAQ